jgi:hypothetical protein
MIWCAGLEFIGPISNKPYLLGLVIYESAAAVKDDFEPESKDAKFGIAAT